MEVASKKLSDYGIEYEASLLKEDGLLPFEDDSLDIVFSFFCFEHIYPIKKHLNEIKRVLKKGGRLIGCIPTEGGLGWGLGRYLTSRRWMKANTKIDYDKVICWEHPNFADFILKELENSFYRKDLEYFPFKFKSIDFNLVIRFEYINHYD